MNFKSIKTKILVVVLAVLFVSLGTVSAVFGVLSIRGTETTVQAILEETSKTAALAMQNRMNVTKNVVNEIGTNARLADSESAYAEKREILDSKVKKYGLVSISVVNPSGFDLEGNNVTDKEFFSKSLSGETYYSTPQVSSEGSGTLIYISAPLWDRGLFNSKVVGVVYITIDGKFLSGISDTISVGETGDAYIIDKDSTFIAHKDESLVNNATTIIEMGKDDENLDNLVKMAQISMNGESCFGEYVYGDIHKVAAFYPIEGTDGWSICVNVGKSEFMKTSYTALVICLGITLISLIIAAIIIVALASKITKPIKEVEKAAEELSKGNFDVEIYYTSKDEIGHLADSMRTMIVRTKAVIDDSARALGEIAKGNFDLHPTVEFMGIFKGIELGITDIIIRLSQILGNIKTSADQVDLGAEQVSIGAQTLAQGSMEQASSIQELTAAVNEISVKVKENVQQANIANEKTTKVGEDLQLSNEQMNNMMLAMEDISEKSKEISKIIKSIEDIAFQTNILALNAAVEAAKDTTALIEETVRAVSEGSTIATETANYIKTVVENAGEVVDAINQISNAFIEQADSISQVTIGLDQISTVVQSNSATAEESAAASEELSGQASMLQEEVDKFNFKQS